MNNINSLLFKNRISSNNKLANHPFLMKIKHSSSYNNINNLIVKIVIILKQKYKVKIWISIQQYKRIKSQNL